jgi:hypothetical protein
MSKITASKITASVRAITFSLALGAVAGVAGLSSIRSAAAETPEEFFRGKTMSIVVYTTTGSGYDLAARMFAHHMP